MEKNGPKVSQLPPIMNDLMFQRSCVAYVGAGFSMAGGMPGWRGLLDNLIDHGSQWLPEENLAHVREAVKSGDLPMAASLLRTMLSAAQINDCLNYTFGTSAFQRANSAQRKHMGERMEMLVRAGWAGIVTTNYDRLIEHALWKLTKGAEWLADVQIDGDASRFCEVLVGAREYRVFYVKLHGSITGAQVVLSTEEYDEVYLRSPQVSTFLQALMLQYHIVFIGCSLEDEVVRIRRKLTADFKGLIPTAYAIMPKNARNEARSRFLKGAASIEPIWYDAPDDDEEHRGLDDLLEQFARIPQPPEDFRSLLRFRKLSDRFNRVSDTNKKLLAYIASQTNRSAEFGDLMDEVTNNAELRASTAHPESELKYRLLFLAAIGLLWEDGIPGDKPKKFLIPTALSDETLRSYGVKPTEAPPSSE